MKFDLDGDAGVDGHALAVCRFEANLFGGADCGLVKPVPQRSDDAQHSNFVRRGEFDLEYYRSLDSERLGLVCVTRLRLE
jgi:hypothetical protein